MKTPLKYLLILLWGCFVLFAAAQNKITNNKKYFSKENIIESISKSKEPIESINEWIIQAKDNQFDSIIPYLQYQKGLIYFKNKMYSESDSIFTFAANNLSDSIFLNEKGQCYFYKGLIAKQTNSSEKVYSFFNQAAVIYESSNYLKGVVYSLMQIGIYFSKQGNYDLAEMNLNNAVTKARTESDQSLINISTLNLGHCLLSQKKYDKALEIYKLVDTIDSKQLSQASYYKLINNLALIHINKKNYSEAEKFLVKSIAAKEHLNDTVSIFNSKLNLLNVYTETNQLNKANVLFESLKPYQKNLKGRQLLDFLFNATYISLKTKSINDAVDYFNLFVNLKDSLSNIAFSDKLIEMQKSFEIQERDNNIALLQKEDELKEARLDNQFLIIITIAGVLLLALTLGYFINRQRIKLKKSKNDLLNQQKEIETINGELKLSNQAKDRILSIIGHDLRGPIGGLKELIELYMEMPGYEEEDFRNLLKAAREASTGSYHLLENLLTWANSQRGEIDFQPVTAPLLPLIKHSIDLLDSSINTRNVSFRYEIPSTIKLTADLNMLRTIIRNLVSNAVKYSPPESCITISARQDNAETFICIADEGYGMSAEQSAVLFEKKETFYIEAGYNAKGTGLGLILCKEFVEQHNGHIWADSQPNIGTKVCFTIPVNLSAKVVKTESLVEAVKTN
ncbi:tetratricopeptide repeat-containing sensor histidine kinase [Carboxylicivirga caseinilyticus]|uniref:tetratricopeptide repeat-containing sensor histidine kinase n=1 Tax=Carboxylicivirga caseinilyticus TaxID=3417572 RepID=UPI003D349CE6|nr:hypothetical protein [Marinilabiliaceae bacterium A049]